MKKAKKRYINDKIKQCSNSNSRQDFSNILSLPFCSIFNACIEEPCLPRIWKSADVIPSPKIVPVKHAATNLRPNSLTPVTSKIGESFIYKWLLESIEDRIDPYQFGAIKNSCTTDALMLMIHTCFKLLMEQDH